MPYSKKQKIFAEYLLRKIGYKNTQLIENYLSKLESIYGRYYKEQKSKIGQNGQTINYISITHSNSECIEQLLKEIEIKKNLESINTRELNLESRISATDLSSFEFCPASYSLSKSFNIEYPTSEDKRLVGTNLHKSLRLIYQEDYETYIKSGNIKHEVLQNEKINKIKNCKLIFAGHTEEKRFFVNEELHYIGQPDYIFKDPNDKFFVVEEKFKYLNNYANPDDYEYEEIINNRNRIKNTFHSNHIIQVQSYLSYIKDYDLEYGVIVYWFYDFLNDKPNIHSVSLKILKKKENEEMLSKTYANFKKFLVDQAIEFDGRINVNKCAACSVNKYCAHKTNGFTEVKLPYNRDDLKLKFIEFPKELKKNEIPDNKRG